MSDRSDGESAAMARALELITGRRACAEPQGEGVVRIAVELRRQLDAEQSRQVAQLALRAKRVGLSLSGLPGVPPQLWIEIEN
ncbi:hypothetical protein [Yinghuangia sp. YIM S10712]|uniref:hypothetical protein n=1 Tax=Yinghuangia sp. YIM S10712 TaxID=3436930 RepID=UPI003F52C731